LIKRILSLAGRASSAAALFTTAQPSDDDPDQYRREKNGPECFSKIKHQNLHWVSWVSPTH
jgi:hypothetical protein